MELESQVPTLELCKKLKELGYPQNQDLFVWSEVGKIPQILMRSTGIAEFGEVLCVAPTVAELGEWLAKFFLWYRSQPVIMKEGWKHHEQKLKLIPIDEANIRAGALIWLVENDYIDFKENK